MKPIRLVRLNLTPIRDVGCSLPELIQYVGPKPKFIEKPKWMTGEMAKAWDSIANAGAIFIDEFDDDWSPIGPKMRAEFVKHGAMENTSGGQTIIFLPEVSRQPKHRKNGG